MIIFFVYEEFHDLFLFIEWCREPFLAWGDMNMQGSLDTNCDSSQNGRGGMFFVLEARGESCCAKTDNNPFDNNTVIIECDNHINHCISKYYIIHTIPISATVKIGLDGRSTYNLGYFRTIRQWLQQRGSLRWWWWWWWWRRRRRRW